MSMDLNTFDSWGRPVGEHLLNGLILSTAIFLGSLLVFRLLFREQPQATSPSGRNRL
jgi:hypothetical protein